MKFKYRYLEPESNSRYRHGIGPVIYYASLMFLAIVLLHFSLGLISYFKQSHKLARALEKHQDFDQKGKNSAAIIYFSSRQVANECFVRDLVNKKSVAPVVVVWCRSLRDSERCQLFCISSVLRLLRGIKFANL